MPHDDWQLAIVGEDCLGECNVCRKCRSKTDMYAEMPIRGDFETGAAVWRIGCLCDDRIGLDKDDMRTCGFQSPDDAINEWNDMNPVKV